MEGMASDYGHDPAPMWLGNKNWKVVPSIAFVKGVPHVMTCHNHKGGSNGRCFYPPMNLHGTLPSPISDQITPAVVRSHNIRQFKAHSYSDTYQMSEMKGQFGGVDTFHLTNHHDFVTESILLQ